MWVAKTRNFRTVDVIYIVNDTTISWRDVPHLLQDTNG